MRIFRRARGGPAPSGYARQSIVTSFRAFQPSPLEEQEEPSYATHRRPGRFSVEVRQENLFCWSLVPELRWRDVVLVADLSFAESNGHSAAGFILRRLDESSFYYFLVSNRGAFRFDLSLNGNHIPLIEWTPSPLVSSRSNHLRVVCRGSYFGFFLEEEWVAEIDDERIEGGALGLAAQNYGDSPRAGFDLTFLSIDGRPREVELAFERFSRALPADRSARVRLAETLTAMGSVEAAIVELNKAVRDGGGTAEELCLLARLYLDRRLYPRALQTVDRCLASFPDHPEALMEKAEALYALNRLVECRDLAASVMRSTGGSAPLALVLGNAQYALGNWREAAEAYLAAWDRERAPLAALNAARSFRRLGQAGRSLELAAAAAEEYFRRGNLEALDELVAEIQAAHGRSSEVRAIEARVAWWRGEEDEAARLLEELVAEGAGPSDAYYLDGLLALRRGDRRRALARFERAVELEPGAAVYWFRLAETRHLLGEDAGPALEEALRLAPDDPWSNNLRGLVLAEKGDLSGAEEAFTLAAERAPESTEIAINLSDVLRRRGRSAEALELLEEAAARSPSAALANQRGNILAASGDPAAAHAEYERALRLEPDNLDYLENCARACIECDLVARAEECLVRLLDARPSPAIYGLVAQVAAIQLQYDRAEAALREGLRLGEDADLLASLASLLVLRGKEQEARAAAAAAARAAAGDPRAEARAARVAAQLRERFEERLRCAGCSRVWWVPRTLPPQPTLRARGDPPDAAPVGACPECGAVYCAGCAREHVVEGRFTCPRCSVPLKVSDPRLAYLFRKSVEDAGGAAP